MSRGSLLKAIDGEKIKELKLGNCLQSSLSKEAG